MVIVDHLECGDTFERLRPLQSPVPRFTFHFILHYLVLWATTLRGISEAIKYLIFYRILLLAGMGAGGQYMYCLWVASECLHHATTGYTRCSTDKYSNGSLR